LQVQFRSFLLCELSLITHIVQQEHAHTTPGKGRLVGVVSSILSGVPGQRTPPELRDLEKKTNNKEKYKKISCKPQPASKGTKRFVSWLPGGIGRHMEIWSNGTLWGCGETSIGWVC